MGKSIIQSFSYSQEDLATMQKLEEIAKREKRSLSYMLVEAAKEYTKAHGSGNNQYTLDSGAAAYPTPWQTEWTTETLEDLSDNDLKAMAVLISGKIDLLDAELDRRRKPVAKPRQNCPYCKAPMLAGDEAHYYSNEVCRRKARTDKKYDGPPFGEKEYGYSQPQTP